jgi:hypothetical protein
MAMVDLTNGKIVGCKEGSKTWFHEKGHIEFNNSERGIKIGYYFIFFQMIAVFFLALSILINNLYLHLFTFMNALGMIICYAYEEVWCWVYGLREYKKSRISSTIPLGETPSPSNETNTD